ncbi:MAG: riboflavin synthase [Candidatus Magasanikbacteria bacterium CG_4_10_14_0_2_um_filter_37_12]|uniref:Riboflavin synthase n=1 Tax=Candidatus Magasanikbacteria bacterium CG_4_10_14_0_2_um_filter_37_12 TaxID=1974637 RepID=A0A2M7V868_9BACT|nr:MAG: riboflavin synthase [Candidatus Magasanikbacteria bacterium CG_4_10_14_0_2_um_filter_37_12]
MFTGIVQGKFRVIDIEEKPDLKTVVVGLSEKLTTGLRIGASVSVAGVCLSVTGIEENNVLFDAMSETLKKTTLGNLPVGSIVNVERSARVGDEIGGHRVSGHVIGTAEIIKIAESENNKAVTFECDRDWMKYIMDKGFVALDGCSLTVTAPDQKSGQFTVWFIPETMKTTTFGDKQVGDKVNLEIDPETQVIVETVERVLKQK